MLTATLQHRLLPSEPPPSSSGINNSFSSTKPILTTNPILINNYDEKYVMGHRCATGRYLLLILEPNMEEEFVDSPLEIDSATETESSYFHLSPQALMGQSSPQTLKFIAFIYGLPVTVLIDTESTHNILQPRIARHLQIPHTPIQPFTVMVGNDSHIHCEGFCFDIPITLQQTLFHIPFYLLSIEGADVVLGMEWLKTLGPISADFAVPSISFAYQNTTITLRGDTTTQPTQSSFHQICHLLHTNSIASMHLLTCSTTTPTDTDPPNITHLPNSTHPQIRNLLQQYTTIFQPPHGLPL